MGDKIKGTFNNMKDKIGGIFTSNKGKKDEFKQ
jgi:hypothetical protein